MTEQCRELSSVNLGRVNLGVAPSAISKSKVESEIAEAGVGTSSIEEHVSRTVIVISELVRVFDPWKVVFILNLITLDSPTSEDTMFVHGWVEQEVSKSNSPIAYTSSTNISIMEFDFTKHASIDEVGFENENTYTVPELASMVAEKV